MTKFTVQHGIHISTFDSYEFAKLLADNLRKAGEVTIVTAILPDGTDIRL